MVQSLMCQFRFHRWTLYPAAALCLLVLGGCAPEPSGHLRFIAHNLERQLMEQDFSSAWCSYDAREQAICILVSERSVPESPSARIVRQTLVMRTFWLPRQGATPLSDSATNMNLDLLIEVDAEAALYRGAGFALVDEINSRHDLAFDIRSATVKLNQQTTGFQAGFTAADVVGQATTIFEPPLLKKQLTEFENKCRGLTKR